MTQIFRIFSFRVYFADFLPFYEFLPFIYFNHRHHRTFFLSLSPLPLCFFRLDFRFSFWSRTVFLGIETTRLCFNYGARVGACVCEVWSHLTVKDYNRERSYFKRLKEFAKCFVNIWMFTYDNFSSFSIFFEMKNVLCASENLFGSDELNRVSRIYEKASSRSSMAAGRLEEVSFSLARQKRVYACLHATQGKALNRNACIRDFGERNQEDIILLTFFVPFNWATRWSSRYSVFFSSFKI